MFSFCDRATPPAWRSGQDLHSVGPPEISRRIAAEAPRQPLADYFEFVAKPFGLPVAEPSSQPGDHA
jgi:hypothetical protein